MSHVFLRTMNQATYGLCMYPPLNRNGEDADGQADREDAACQRTQDCQWTWSVTLTVPEQMPRIFGERA